MDRSSQPTRYSQNTQRLTETWGVFVYVITDLTCLTRAIAFNNARVDKDHKRLCPLGDMSGLSQKEKV